MDSLFKAGVRSVLSGEDARSRSEVIVGRTKIEENGAGFRPAYSSNQDLCVLCFWDPELSVHILRLRLLDQRARHKQHGSRHRRRRWISK